VVKRLPGRCFSPRARPHAAALLWAALALVLPGEPAHAQGVPPAATPGGALPRPPPARLEDAPPEQRELFPVPPAVERPLDAEVGERLFVTQFKLLGVHDYPKEGISRDELESLVEDLRREHLGLTDVDENGFTANERRQISDFMRGIVDDPEGQLPVEALRDLVEDLRTKRIRRGAGMTIGQIQEVASAVTEYYRSRGLILAQAFIPAQQVADGVVVIEVFEGLLGDVVAQGNEMYSDEVLAEPFRDLIEAPVAAGRIETAMLTASDYPGLNLFGVFQPGTDVGETDLVLRVQDERRFDASLRYDNHGTRFTGEQRIFLDVAVNNPTGAGDRLYGAFLQQFDPTNGKFWQFEYQRPILVPGLRVGAGYQKNPFDVGAELRQVDLSGESEIGRVFLRKSLVRSRRENVFGSLTWRRSDAVTQQAGLDIAEDHLSVLEAELNFDGIDTRGRGINAGSLGFTFGLGDLLGGHDLDTATAQPAPPSRQGGSGTFASNDFFKVYGSFSRLQKLAEDVSLVVRTEAQWSNDLLTSLEQFSIGGPASVRAFSVSEALTDMGAFGSAELIINAPGFARAPAFKGLTWGEVLRVSFFTDFAWGELNDPSPTDLEKVTFAGYGAGLAIGLPGRVQGRLQYARPFGSKTSADGDSSQWWLDLTVRF